MGQQEDRARRQHRSARDRAMGVWSAELAGSSVTSVSRWHLVVRPNNCHLIPHSYAMPTHVSAASSHLLMSTPCSWLTTERPECKRCVNYGAECVYPVKKAFDPAAVDAALGSRHNRQSNVAATAAAFQSDPAPMGSSSLSRHKRPDRGGSPPTLPPLIAANQPPRADQRSTIEDLPPIEIMHALFRKTKMGSFFNNPGMTPPEFLQHAFPNPEDLRCVRPFLELADSSSTTA